MSQRGREGRSQVSGVVKECRKVSESGGESRHFVPRSSQEPEAWKQQRRTCSGSGWDPSRGHFVLDVGS